MRFVREKITRLLFKAANYYLDKPGRKSRDVEKAVRLLRLAVEFDDLLTPYFGVKSN